jgi:hypothetical protein
MKQRAAHDNLTLVLCKHFKFDPKFLTYVEEHEMRYIYAHAEKRVPIKAKRSDILSEVSYMQKTAPLSSRGKRRRLYELFRYCQSTAMTESGRYDTSTQALPPAPTKQPAVS